LDLVRVKVFKFWAVVETFSVLLLGLSGSQLGVLVWIRVPNLWFWFPFLDMEPERLVPPVQVVLSSVGQFLKFSKK